MSVALFQPVVWFIRPPEFANFAFSALQTFARIQAEKPHETQGTLERPFVGLSAAKNHGRNDYDKN